MRKRDRDKETQKRKMYIYEENESERERERERKRMIEREREQIYIFQNTNLITIYKYSNDLNFGFHEARYEGWEDRGEEKGAREKSLEAMSTALATLITRKQYFYTTCKGQ